MSTGRRPILLIRPDGNDADAAALAGVGVPTLIEPLLATGPSGDAAPARELADELDRAGAGGWLVITSPRTWRHWLEGVDDLSERLVAALAAGLRLAAVGSATTASLPVPAERVLISPGTTAEDLLELLLSQPQPLARTSSAILPLSARARSVLPDGLRAAGWQVHAAAVYDTRPREPSAATVAGLAAGDFAGVLVRSPSAADALAVVPVIAAGTEIVAVGPVTAARCRAHGWPVVEIQRTDPAAVAHDLAKCWPDPVEGSAL